jgi:hypothetical protein
MFPVGKQIYVITFGKPRDLLLYVLGMYLFT